VTLPMLTRGWAEAAVPGEEDVRHTARRILAAACEIPAGARIARQIIAARRPGTGLASGLMTHVVGRVAKRHIASQEAFDWEVLG
jgi:N-acetylneuraminate synthase/N,N'-diacetyllegionaminate synthase